MNKIYRVIWNASLGAWVAVSELAKSKGKTSSHSGIIGETAEVENQQHTVKYLFLKPLTVALLVISGPDAFAYQAGSGQDGGGNNQSVAISGSDCPTGAVASALHSTSIGCYSVSMERAVAIGMHARAIGTGAVALGEQALAANGAIAIGVQADAPGNLSISMGTVSRASGAGGVAVGHLSRAIADYTTALGQDAGASGLGSTALGRAAGASKENSVALGSNSTTLTAATIETQAQVGGITYGGFIGKAATEGMQVSVGAKDKERQIKHLAAGKVAADSTDGINGSQLMATNVVVGNVAGTTKTILGGNAAVGTDGSLSMTNIGGTGKNNIDDAIKASKTTVKSGTNTNVTYDASTNTYTVNSTGGTGTGTETHYFSVNDGGVQKGNYNNDGATGIDAVAIGTAAKAELNKAIALGSGAKVARGSISSIVDGGIAIGQDSLSKNDGISIGRGAKSNEGTDEGGLRLV